MPELSTEVTLNSPPIYLDISSCSLRILCWKRSTGLGWKWSLEPSSVCWIWTRDLSFCESSSCWFSATPDHMNHVLGLLEINSNGHELSDFLWYWGGSSAFFHKTGFESHQESMHQFVIVISSWKHKSLKSEDVLFCYSCLSKCYEYILFISYFGQSCVTCA